MTYVDYDNADMAIGYITDGSTARAGYNGISDGTINMSHTDWGENKITYLKIDASGITDANIINAVLSLDVSGSSDSKRVCEYGILEIPYTDWDDTLTYNSAVSNNMLSGTVIGDTMWTSTKSADMFETKTIDITDVIKNDADRVVTLAIYETKAAGGYIKNPSVEIEHNNSAFGIAITANPDIGNIEATEEEQSIIYTAIVAEHDGTVMENEQVTWTVTGTDSYTVSEKECIIAIPAKASDMEITVTASSVTDESITASKQLIVAGYTGGTVLEREMFEESTGGFKSVSNVAVVTESAESEGMSGDVLTVVPEKSGSSSYTSYEKVYNELITSQQFVSVQFDIAAQHRDGKGRVVNFGAYDVNNNPLFSLSLSETNAATISVNNQAAVTVTDMLPNASSTSISGTSYRVNAEFNFFTKKQHIKITPTADKATVLLDETYDITTAENLGKLGMPEGVAWIYGAISLDNLITRIPALRKVSFNISDNNSNAVNNAVVTIYGADGLTKDITSENGVAEIELPNGDYSYTVNGHGGQCTSITKHVSFTVADEDITEDISLFAFDGPTANKIELTTDTDASSINAGKTERKIVYTAIIRDQDENIMDSEKVTWTVSGTDN